jgi:hypothetical protein
VKKRFTQRRKDAEGSREWGKSNEQGAMNNERKKSYFAHF